MSETYRLAHVSDLHVLDLTGVGWERYLNKRLTGMVNLRIGRKDAHPIAMCEALVDDVNAQAPDHVAITGDVTNLALQSEFAKAAELLAPLGGYEQVSIIPGNHDIYTGGSKRTRRFEATFGHWMWPAGTSAETGRYPWVKPVAEGVTLIGMNSAHPVAPLFAYGWVEDDQLAEAGARAKEHDGAFVVGMVHHNLHRRSARKNFMHGLRNRDAVLDTCADAGVDLLLHGHTHVANRFEYRGMSVVGCGSSTWDSEDPAHTGRYNVYHLQDGALARIQVRQWDVSQRAYVDVGDVTVP